MVWKCENLDGGIVIARHNAPPMNYLSRHGMAALVDLIGAWRDESVRAVILCGAPGGRFVTHYSCEELLKLVREPALLRAHGLAMSHAFHEMLRGLNRLPKPVIAAMNGDAMGGGFELALACDIRVGERGDYRYGLPEVTLGMVPGGSGTQRLSRVLGAGQAVDLILRGRLFPPDVAHGRGLVHELADDAVAHAITLARDLVLQAPVALAAAKRAVWGGAGFDMDAGLEIEAEGFVASMLAPEARRALEEYVALPFAQRRAWLERRA